MTGLATVGGTLYAVSNQGGLYRTGDLTTAVEGNIGTYIATATDLIGLNFVGLSAGPRNLEAGNTGLPGRFANMLFGVTAGGELYAFDTAGVLQPVFAGGATHINIGSGVTDIDFSTLDLNLWHATGTRGADPGHGINAAANGARGETPGGTSLYFGAERVQNAFNNAATDPFFLPRQDGQPVLRTYNFPGGAKGAVESNTINLAGYSASDRPMLYFNYFLQSDNVDSISDFAPDQDAFRVYVITDDGVHHLLATNNNAKGPSARSMMNLMIRPKARIRLLLSSSLTRDESTFSDCLIVQTTGVKLAFHWLRSLARPTLSCESSSALRHHSTMALCDCER